MMKFSIKDIGPEGRKIETTLNDSQVREFLTSDGIELLSTLAFMELNLQLTKVEETVFVRGRVNGEYSVICGKCLGEARIKLDEPEVAVTFLPPSNKHSSDEEALAFEDLDTTVHDGETIDLEPLIHEQLLLALPISPLCRPDCRGICPRCGAELNFESCKCEDGATKESSWIAHVRDLKKSMFAETN